MTRECYGLTPQDLHWQLEPQLQELGPEHWQGPIVYEVCSWLVGDEVDV
jgi:hypothetical protein